jgi:hypothetical protein
MSDEEYAIFYGSKNIHSRRADGDVEESSPLVNHRSRSRDTNSSSSSSSSSSFRYSIAISLLFTMGLVTLGVMRYQGSNSMGALGGAGFFAKSLDGHNVQASMAKVASEHVNHQKKDEEKATFGHPGVGHPNRHKKPDKNAIPAWDGFHDICTLNSNANVQKRCPHSTTKLVVGGDDDGKWPVGFSWTLLKESLDGKNHERSFLHSEKGNFDDAKLVKGKELKCRHYVTELCLAGDYIVYANSGMIVIITITIIIATIIIVITITIIIVVVVVVVVVVTIIIDIVITIVGSIIL